jgi:hypothetical protein
MAWNAPSSSGVYFVRAKAGMRFAVILTMTDLEGVESQRASVP